MALSRYYIERGGTDAAPGFRQASDLDFFRGEAGHTIGDRAVLPGLALARINPAVASELKLPLTGEGVVVTDPGRFAPRIGLRQGDVLKAINGRAVETPADVDRLLREAAPRIQIDALRGGARVTLRFRT